MEIKESACGFICLHIWAVWKCRCLDPVLHSHLACSAHPLPSAGLASPQNSVFVGWLLSILKSCLYRKAFILIFEDNKKLKLMIKNHIYYYSRPPVYT